MLLPDIPILPSFYASLSLLLLLVSFCPCRPPDPPNPLPSFSSSWNLPPCLSSRLLPSHHVRPSRPSVFLYSSTLAASSAVPSPQRIANGRGGWQSCRWKGGKEGLMIVVEAGFNLVATLAQIWEMRHYLMRSPSDHCQSASGMKVKRQRQRAALSRRGVVPAHTASVKMQGKCATSKKKRLRWNRRVLRLHPRFWWNAGLICWLCATLTAVPPCRLNLFQGEGAGGGGGGEGEWMRINKGSRFYVLAILLFLGLLCPQFATSAFRPDLFLGKRANQAACLMVFGIYWQIKIQLIFIHLSFGYII